MPRPTEETRCETCQWYEYEPSVCKRYPPTYEPNLDKDGGYPEVHSNHWCGEFTPIKQEKEVASITLEAIISRMESGPDKDWMTFWIEKLEKAWKRQQREENNAKTN